MICLEEVVGETLLSINIFHRNPLAFLKIQTVMCKTYCLIPRASNLATLKFSLCSFHFLHSLSYILQQIVYFLGKALSHDASCKGPIEMKAGHLFFSEMKRDQRKDNFRTHWKTLAFSVVFLLVCIFLSFYQYTFIGGESQSALSFLQFSCTSSTQGSSHQRMCGWTKTCSFSFGGESSTTCIQ